MLLESYKSTYFRFGRGQFEVGAVEGEHLQLQVTVLFYHYFLRLTPLNCYFSRSNFYLLIDTGLLTDSLIDFLIITKF